MQQSQRFLILLTMPVIVILAFVAVNRLTNSRAQRISRTAPPKIQTFRLTPVLECKNCVFHDVSISDDRVAWAVGYDGQDPQKLYRSMDGGQTWRSKPIVTDGFILKAISFVDRKNGWAVGAGIVLNTEDGGETWKRLTILPETDLNKVQFATTQVGYAVGQTEWGHEIMRTTNGGRSWRKVREAPRSGFVFGIATIGEKIVVAAINDDHVSRTEDGGKTWIDSALTGAASVAFTSEGVGWLVGRQGSFLRSTDQGKTWQRPGALPDSFLQHDWTSISFAHNGKGVAVSKDGTIAITYDGMNWLEGRTNTNENLGSVRLNDMTGLVIGSQRIYKFALSPQVLSVSAWKNLPAC